MQDTPGEGDRRALAEEVRRACVAAAAAAYEQAREDGLCAEGAWEAAVAAIRSLDLAPLLARGGALGRAEPRFDQNW